MIETIFQTFTLAFELSKQKGQPNREDTIRLPGRATEQMKITTAFLISISLLFVACGPKTVVTKEIANSVTKINFLPSEEEEYTDMEIFMALNPKNPAYPMDVANNLNTERLRLTFVRSETGKDSYYALFRFFPTEEVSTIRMEDFKWFPFIDFESITLPKMSTKKNDAIAQ